MKKLHIWQSSNTFLLVKRFWGFLCLCKAVCLRNTDFSLSLSLFSTWSLVVIVRLESLPQHSIDIGPVWIVMETNATFNTLIKVSVWLPLPIETQSRYWQNLSWASFYCLQCAHERLVDLFKTNKKVYKIH